MKEKYRESWKLIGDNIRYYRKLNHYTQKQLGDLIGMDRTLICKFERCRARVTIVTLFDLSEAFNIPLYKLLKYRE